MLCRTIIAANGVNFLALPRESALRIDTNDMSQGASVFISYRRADAAGHAGSLYDRFKSWFDAEDVFYDQGNIGSRDDFPEQCSNSPTPDLGVELMDQNRLLAVGVRANRAPVPPPI